MRAGHGFDDNSGDLRDHHGTFATEEECEAYYKWMADPKGMSYPEYLDQVVNWPKIHLQNQIDLYRRILHAMFYIGKQEAIEVKYVEIVSLDGNV